MYEEEEAKARALYDEHKQMAENYGKVQQLNELKAHCERLASFYKSAAREYASMATLEHEEGKTAK